jgi:hypothetical protein
MKKTKITIRKRVEGEVEFNDGEFAEIQTTGAAGIEEEILLDTIQIQRTDTEYTADEFKRRFSVGTAVNICTTTEITNQSGHSRAS